MGDLLRHSIKLETKIKWLENGLKEIANGRDDMNGIYIKQQAQAILDGEPTTADEYNINEGRRGQGYDYGEFEDENDFDVSPDAPVVRLGTLIPENTVRISDVNEEIAKEWKNEEILRLAKEEEENFPVDLEDRDREERISKEKTK